jgi:hypothetical protein
MIKKYLKIKQEYTDAAKARGARQLFRLEVTTCRASKWGQACLDKVGTVCGLVCE